MIVCGGTYPWGGYSTNIWVQVSRWGFETLTLCRTKKKSYNTYFVWDNTLSFITLLRTRSECTPCFKAIVFVYLEYKQIPSSKSNRSCRQYPVYNNGQTCAKLCTLFRTQVKYEGVPLELIIKNLPFILSQVARPFLQDPCNWREQAWLLLCER